MKTFSLILGLALLYPFPSEALERHCKGKRTKTVAEQIANLNPQTDFDLMDLNLFEGGSVTSGYDYEVEPAYTKGLYARKDKWVISAKAVPGLSLEMDGDWDLNLSAGVQNSTEATFIRFMKDPCEAMLANPYAPNRIPLKRKIALGPKFNVGDYFLFRASAGFVASGEIVGLLGTPLWGLTLGGSYALDGFYQLHIVRLDEKHVRFKIVGHRSRNLTANLGVGYKEKFEVFEVRQLDRQLERFVNTKPIQLTASKGKSKIFMVDYILDLTDEKVSDSFEKSLRKIKDFRNLDLAGPFKKQASLEANLLLDLTPLEDLFRSDYANNNVKRIRRNLRTTSEQDAYGIGINVGNRIIGFKLNGAGSAAKMNLINPGETSERYLLRTWEKSWESRFLYSYSKNRSEDSLSALFSADKTFAELVPLNVVRQMSRRKNRFSFRNFQALKLMLRKALPLVVYKQIPFDRWNQQPRETYYNFGFRYELLMAPESILLAPELKAEEIKRLFTDYIAEKEITAYDFFTVNSRDSDGHNPETEMKFYISSLAQNLERALGQNLPMEQRLEEITKLRQNPVFVQSGIGFLMTLHPKRMNEYFHLDLDISSNESLIEFTFGQSQSTVLYKKILTIKAALDDDAFDLLREAESISIKEDSSGQRTEAE